MSHSQHKRFAVYRRDGGRCLKCNTKYNLTLDHVVPKCKGGPAHKGNLQTLCKKCNMEKGHETIDYRENWKGIRAINLLEKITKREAYKNKWHTKKKYKQRTKQRNKKNKKRNKKHCKKGH